MEQMVSEILEILGQHRAKNYSQTLTSYGYFKEGPAIYDALINSGDYECFNKEKSLLADVCETLLNEPANPYDSLQILDLGVGNGLKWEDAFWTLRKKVPTEYLGLDISEPMIEFAKRRFCGPGIGYANADFLDLQSIHPHLSKDASLRIISMLGNTICNFIDDSRQLETLRQMQEYDSKPSFIILGLELFTGDIDRLLKAYCNDLTKRIDFIPLQILGVDSEIGIHEIVFNEELLRIEEWFHVSEDSVFTPPYQHAEFKLQRDDAILLSVTRKPTHDELLHRLSSVWELGAIAIRRQEANAIVVIEASYGSAVN
jgi:uncharacterized SAM-dependent methyltransferase